MSKKLMITTRSGSRRLRGGIKILALAMVCASAASATALMYPKRDTGTQTAPRLERISLASALSSPKPAPVPSVPVSRATDADAAPRVAVRQIPLSGGVDPTPAAPPANPPSAPAAAPPAPVGPAATATSNELPRGVVASAATPIACLPDTLKSVLNDVQARFGTVTLVSTTALHTDNHAAGSERHRLHSDCRAADFKVDGDLSAVTAYLRTRPEVAGINTYKNNRVIHIDAAMPRMAARR